MDSKYAISLVVLAVVIFGGLLLFAPDGDRDPSQFETVTVEEDRTVYKNLPVLSGESLAKLPDSFFRFVIFGANAEVLDASTTDDVFADGREVTVQEVRTHTTSDFKELYTEYEEYFTATGWTFLEKTQSKDVASLIVEDGPWRVAVSLFPDPDSSGSTIRITRTVFTL